MSKQEMVSGSYGGMAVRQEDRRFWTAYDSDYRWKAVTDDFGNLVSVGPHVNMRGY